MNENDRFSNLEWFEQLEFCHSITEFTTSKLFSKESKIYWIYKNVRMCALLFSSIDIKTWILLNLYFQIFVLCVTNQLDSAFMILAF